MNKRLKMAMLLFAIILVAALAISVAYSKYYSKVSGTGSATVAKWNFKVNGQEDNLGTITLGNTAAVNPNVAEGRIAPQTNGSFDVALDATGTEVALDYTIKFSNVQGNIPTNLKFYATKTESGYADEITDITTAGLTGSIGLDESKTKTVTIYWNWDYETGADDEIAENDEIDTTAGETPATITFDVVVTGTQQKYVPQQNG